MLSLTPVDPADAIPFERLVLDPNQAGQTLEKMLADIDGDGRLDAIVGQRNGTGIYWYAQPASEIVTDAWQKYTIIGTGNPFEDILPLDVNRDGAVDVIASIDNTVQWFENPRGHGNGAGDPRSEPWIAHLIGNVEAHDMLLADLDLDGRMDIATNNAIYFQNSPTSWTRVSGANYARTGVGVGLIDIGERTGPILRAADHTRPAHPVIDLVGTGPTTAPYASYWYENPIHRGGNPRTDAWVRHYIGPIFDPNYSNGGICYEQLDVNGDGRVDLLTGQSEQPNDFAPPPPEGLAWYEAPVDRRNGTWIRHQVDVGLTNVHKIRIADMNLDGTPDLVIAEQEQSVNDRVAVLFNHGGTGADWRIQVLSTGSGHNQYVADIDGDGDMDILNAPHGVFGAPHPIELYVNGLRTVSATAPPKITVQPQSRTVNAGQAVTFFVAARGAPRLSYQWQRNGVNIPGATNAWYTLPAAAPGDGGATFSANVSNAFGNAASNAAALTVTGPPPPVYLSDLDPTFATNGYGPYERDHSNGEQGANDGHTITLNSVTYAKGLGTHAASDLRYTLAGLYGMFQADVGVDDEVGNSGSVVFQVWADGTKIYDSGTMTGSSATRSINLSLAGKNELRLVVTDSGNGNTDDHADWAGARLVPAAPRLDASPRAALPFASVPLARHFTLEGAGDVLDDLVRVEPIANTSHGPDVRATGKSTSAI